MTNNSNDDNNILISDMKIVKAMDYYLSLFKSDKRLFILCKDTYQIRREFPFDCLRAVFNKLYSFLRKACI